MTTEPSKNKAELRELARALRAILGARQGWGYEWFIRLAVLRCLEVRGSGSGEVQSGREALARMKEAAGVLPDFFRVIPPAVKATAHEACVKRAIGLLWDPERRRELDELLGPASSPGWLHQYWVTVDKDKVAARMRRKEGKKIAGRGLIEATCVYTEAHHAKFLVENSLGAMWRGRGSGARERWEFFSGNVGGGGRSARDLSVIDPACGAGHMLLAVLDVLYAMHASEDENRSPGEVCRMILSRNLFGLDIDARAVRLARTSLVLRCLELDPGFVAPEMNIHLATGRGVRAGLGALYRPRGLRSAAREDPGERLFAREFDAVVTNPPFVGFRKLGAHLREYLARTDPLAVSDLAVAFISRCHSMVRNGGRLGVVAPAAWMTSRPAAPLRRKMLEEGGPVVLAALGQRVFDTAPLLFASLAVIERKRGGGGGAVRVLTCADGSAESLRAAVQGGGRVVGLEGMRASRDAAFVGGVAMGLGRRWTTMGELFSFVDGVWSGDNARDVRESWEVDADDPEWVPASGGQGYRRWYAPIARRIRASFVEDWAAMERRAGSLEYARVAGGKLAARLVAGHSAAVAGVVTAIPKEGCFDRVLEALAIFNTRVGTLWLRSLTSGLNFNPGYAARVPVPVDPLAREVRELVERAVAIKREIASCELACDEFEAARLERLPGESGAAWIGRLCRTRLELQSELLACEARIEAGVREWTGVPEVELGSVRLPAEMELERWERKHGGSGGELQRRMAKSIAEDVLSVWVLRECGVDWPRCGDQAGSGERWSGSESGFRAAIDRIRESMDALGPDVYMDFGRALDRDVGTWFRRGFFLQHHRQFRGKPLLDRRESRALSVGA